MSASFPIQYVHRAAITDDSKHQAQAIHSTASNYHTDTHHTIKRAFNHSLHGSEARVDTQPSANSRSNGRAPHTLIAAPHLPARPTTSDLFEKQPASPRSFFHLGSVIQQFGSQPDLLQLILSSKVQEDRRRAEEAKLRRKEIDVLLQQDVIVRTTGRSWPCEPQPQHLTKDSVSHQPRSSSADHTTRHSWRELSNESDLSMSVRTSRHLSTSLSRKQSPERHVDEPMVTEWTCHPPISSSPQCQPKLPPITLTTGQHNSNTIDMLIECSPPSSPATLAPLTHSITARPAHLPSVKHPWGTQSSTYPAETNDPRHRGKHTFPITSSNNHLVLTPPAVDTDADDHAFHHHVSPLPKPLSPCYQPILPHGHPKDKFPILVASSRHMVDRSMTPRQQRQRRKRELHAITTVVETRDFPYMDGYTWKNNGNTIQKKSGLRSIYYKCSNSPKGCPVNKTVIFQKNNSYLIKYRGQHLLACNRVQSTVDV